MYNILSLWYCKFWKWIIRYFTLKKNYRHRVSINFIVILKIIFFFQKKFLIFPSFNKDYYHFSLKLGKKSEFHKNINIIIHKLLLKFYNIPKYLKREKKALFVAMNVEVSNVIPHKLWIDSLLTFCKNMHPFLFSHNTVLKMKLWLYEGTTNFCLQY